MFAIGVTVGLVGAFQIPFHLLDSENATDDQGTLPSCLFQVGLFVHSFVHLFTKIKFTLVGDCIL